LLTNQILLVGSFLFASRVWLHPPAGAAKYPAGAAVAAADASMAAALLRFSLPKELTVKTPHFFNTPGLGQGQGQGLGQTHTTGSTRIGASATEVAGRVKNRMGVMSYYNRLPALTHTQRGKVALTAVFSPIVLMYLSMLWVLPDQVSAMSVIFPFATQKERMQSYRETRDDAIKAFKGIFLGDVNRPTLQETWNAIRSRFSASDAIATSTFPSSGAAVAAAANTCPAPAPAAAVKNALKDLSFIGQIRNKHIFQVADAISATISEEDINTADVKPKGYEDDDEYDDDDMYYNVYNCEISESLSPHRMWAGASLHDPFSWNRIKHACWTRPIQENVLYNGIILRSLLTLPGVPPIMSMIMTAFLYMLHTAETPENQVQTSWFPMSLEEYQVSMFVCMCTPMNALLYENTIS